MEIKKVLFIVPPSKTFDDFANPKSNARIKKKGNKYFGHIVADMPLGVLSMSAFIKKYLPQIETELLDFNVVLNKAEEFEYSSFFDFFADVIKEVDSPDVVCISSLFGSAYESTLEISSVCKVFFKDIFILAGGSIPMNMADEIFNQTGAIVDAICYGEGEKPLLEFLLNPKLETLIESKSWITNYDEGRPEHDYIYDLDMIPFPDYDLCDPNDYGIAPAITAYSAVKKSANYHFMTSRGCPYSCTFCASSTVHGKEMRYLSIKRVKHDLMKLKFKYNAEMIIFQDDHFLEDADRALEIIRFLKNLNLKIVFQNGLAIQSLTREILVAMKDAGINQLVLPVESGSRRVLKELMHKPLTTDKIKEVVSDCWDLGIYTDINIILGMPGETEDDIFESLEFLKSIKANWFRIHVATPLIGSSMYNTCIEKGYLKSGFEKAHYKNAIIETEHMTAERLEQLHTIVNIDLNFVSNYDLKSGNYAVALEGFENSIGARPDLPFAYYCASRCYEALGDKEKAKEYYLKAKEIVDNSEKWKSLFDYFRLELI